MDERDPGFPPEQREAVYRVIAERRDVRRGFRADPVPADVLGRVLAAAHQAPSVGFSQPWDFIVITDRARRERIAALARQRRDEFAADLPGGRARAFDRLKIESILDTPVNIVVTCDRTRGGRHTLGRTLSRGPRIFPACWRWRTCGWRPGPRVSGSAG